MAGRVNLKVCVVLFILVTSFLISVQTAFADPNLVSWWEFDEGIGSIAYDSAGTNNGTITGASWFDDPCRGMCLSFDGNGDYVLVGDKDSLELQEFTLSFWARLNNSSGSLQGGIAKGYIFGDATMFSYTLQFSDENAIAAITNTSDAGFGVNCPIVDSNWHIWSMTVGGGTLTLYKDGAFASSTEYTGVIDYSKRDKMNNFLIGARNSSTSYAFNGKIDDVRFYDKALSAGEIWQLYLEGLGLTASNPSPLNGTTGVNQNIVLSWLPGKDAASHDVYFGADYSDVNNADTSSPEYMGNFDVNSFDPCGLDFSTTYYWRIDEVNSSNVWKGNVWSFTTVPSPPGQVSNPSPTNLATDVNLFPVLSWTVGTGAVSHDVYFGTANPPPFQINQSGTSYNPGRLNIGKTYYWRIDEVNPGGTTTGIVWRFTTTNEGEPNLFGWWKFDEGSGTIAYDSACDNDGTITGAAWFDDSYRGMCLSFDGSGDYVLVGDKDNLEQQAFTLSFWARLNNPSAQSQGGIAKGHIFGDGTQFSYSLDFSGGSAMARITNTSNYSIRVTYPIADSNWHMWSMTVGGETLTLYKDGVFAISTGYAGPIDYTKTYNNFVIGARYNGDYSFNGKIDDVRFYNKALSTGEIQQLYQEGLGLKAYNPNPADGATGVNPNTVLSWLPGKGSASHDVYFGANCNDVNNANTSSPEYKGNFDVNTFGPGGLDFSTTYYWRIDEVNEPNVWKGAIWSFTTARPAIGLSAMQFQFTAVEGGANPSGQILGISNIGVGILNWQINEDCAWLSVEPNSGSSTGEVDDVNLSVDISGLSAGMYTCNLTISDTNASNNPQATTITFHVVDSDGTLYVPSEYPTIQAAIDVALDHDVVIVAPGTYTGTGNKNLNFVGKAITVRSSEPNDPNIVAATVIDCANSGRGFRFNNGEEPNSVVSGFTITRGYEDSVGGGIFCNGTSPTIENCIITGNKAIRGGGIYQCNGPIINCIIENNKAAGSEFGFSEGGGLYNCNGLISNCVITGNSSIQMGGGLFACHGTISNCFISGNVASAVRGISWGGGLYACDNVIENCIISSNKASSYGGGIYCHGDYPKIQNCIIRNNNGGGICSLSNSRPTITNCTVYGNNASSLSNGGIYCAGIASLSNCIIWANGDDLYGCSATYSCISDTNDGGTGVIHTDPCFINAAAGNLHLLHNSPCIDAGDPDFIPESNKTDIDGDPRVIGLRIDMGADEVDNQLLVPTEYETIQAAINASFNGDTVIVAPGIYTGDGNRDINFLGKAIKVRSENGPRNCIIDCLGRSTDQHRGFIFESGENANTILDGFTITQGHTDYGGGIYCYMYSSPKITNCIISTNRANTFGGGICCLYGCSPMITNCVFNANLSGNRGGGIYSFYESYPVITNCTIVNNSAELYGDGLYAEWAGLIIENSIIWGNIPEQITLDQGTALTTYSNIQGGWAGTANINTDPCFVNPDSNDLHLLPNSPCINTGDPNFIPEPNDTDIDGEHRVMLGRVDMGADEFNPFEIEFIVVNKRRVGRTLFEYDCNVTLTNISLFTVSNVQFEIVDASENIVLIDPNVTFGVLEIGPGESAISSDMCTFQIDRSEPAEIMWQSTYEMVDGVQYTISSVCSLKLGIIGGDITGDNKVDLDDLEILVDQWLQSPGTPSADIVPPPDGDNIVNFLDFALLADNWLRASGE